MKNKPIASLSLDLDNKWSYMKTHGDPNWDTFPSYLDKVVPRFLDFLEQHNQKITVFVVGQDAVLKENREALSWISAAGHEIGNHSFNHEPWLHLYTPAELDEEFARTERALIEVTGQKPVGFRGPGFSFSDQVLKTPINRGYEYDCSTFPTYLGPVARAYYFMSAELSKKEKEDRKQLFGSFSDGFQSNRPFQWQSESRRLLEIPVTTFPIIKAPIHLSYLLYLNRFSNLLARSYFWSALQGCRMAGIGPSILLHPLDFMGAEDDQDLAFFPAMDQPAAKKIELVSDVLKMMSKRFEILPMREHARLIRRTSIRGRNVDSAPQGASPLAGAANAGLV